MQLALCERHHRQQDHRSDHDDDGDVLHDQGQFVEVAADIQRSARARFLIHNDRSAFDELTVFGPWSLPRELDALSGLAVDGARALVPLIHVRLLALSKAERQDAALDGVKRLGQIYPVTGARRYLQANGGVVVLPKGVKVGAAEVDLVLAGEVS